MMNRRINMHILLCILECEEKQFSKTLYVNGSSACRMISCDN